MQVNFRVSGRIAKPVAEVFEAVADPEKLSRYFTTGGAEGRIEPGATVTWDFHDFPGAFPVEVIEVVPNEKIVLEWDASEGESG
ncbi:MAG: SRPBCC domain-containing protein, partial [Erythrobacter sp.]|nr:SRPBCC domain-containing protein [Erythrobacter sp.]